jgi:hypothetical protein
MRNYVERAKDFVEQVYPYIANCMSPWKMNDFIHQFNADFDRKVIVRSGLSRIALITSDYVVKFDYDPDEVESIGGCYNEMAVYDMAQREGFAYLFAQITPFPYSGRTFFIMPRIRGIGSGNRYAEDYMTPSEKDFCRRHRITDLHTENYGFRKGHVCIVDYACNLDYESSSEYDCYYDNRTAPSSF